MSSSNTTCERCKWRRRKCPHDCFFAPYFPPDDPQKFLNIHKVFRARNITIHLKKLNASQRQIASLAYEAEVHLQDTVYVCFGLISLMQHRLQKMEKDLRNLNEQIAMLLVLQPPASLQQYVGNSMMQQEDHSHRGSSTSRATAKIRRPGE